MDDRFDRVHIGRRRVHGGLASIAMGLLGSALALDVLYVVVGESAFYDTAWFVLLAAGVFLAAAIMPGIFAWIEESRSRAAYMTRDDDGRVVVLAAATMVLIVNLVLRAEHGAITSGELGAAFALTVASLGLMGLAGPIGDWLADRLPASRYVIDFHPERGPEAARERETTLR